MGNGGPIPKDAMACAWPALGSRLNVGSEQSRPIVAQVRTLRRDLLRVWLSPRCRSRSRRAVPSATPSYWRRAGGPLLPAITPSIPKRLPIRFSCQEPPRAAPVNIIPPWTPKIRGHAKPSCTAVWERYDSCASCPFARRTYKRTPCALGHPSLVPRRKRRDVWHCCRGLRSTM